jgi:hypothetical protein
MKEATYFFVTSYGRTATVWLTRALNLHPDVVCNHGPSLYQFSARQGKQHEEEGFLQVQKTAGVFYGLSLREILHLISANGEKKCVGNVHAYTAWNLYNKRKAEAEAPPIRTINLLRHPITRIDSFWRRFQYEHTLNSPSSQWIEKEAMKEPRYQQVLEELRRHHDVMVEGFDERAFFHAVMQMSTDAGDLSIEVPHIVSERLVADIDYFAYVFDLLTGRSVSISSKYLRGVSDLGKQNAERGGGRSAIEVFEEWQPWQRTLFLLILRDHTVLREAYPCFGYDFPYSPLLGSDDLRKPPTGFTSFLRRKMEGLRFSMSGTK